MRAESCKVAGACQGQMAKWRNEQTEQKMSKMSKMKARKT